MNQQGNFTRMREPLAANAGDYWKMVAVQCAAGDDEQIRFRFLKFLLAGFCMFVQELPGHPVGMPFPGGDKVEIIDGIYYCPVREKANDVDAALCPFCPALQTPEIGYSNRRSRGASTGSRSSSARPMTGIISTGEISQLTWV